MVCPFTPREVVTCGWVTPESARARLTTPNKTNPRMVRVRKGMGIVRRLMNPFKKARTGEVGRELAADDSAPGEVVTIVVAWESLGSPESGGREFTAFLTFWPRQASLLLN